MKANNRKNWFTAFKPNYSVPVGKSATIKGSHLSIEELLRTTTLAMREGVKEVSPLFDEYPDGNIPAEKILEDMDFCEIPIDLTDQQMMIEKAQSRLRSRYMKELEKKKNKVSIAKERAKRAKESEEKPSNEVPDKSQNPKPSRRFLEE